MIIYKGIQRAIVEEPQLADALGFKEFVGPDDEAEGFGGSDAPELQEQVAMALVIEGVRQGQLGQSEAAIATYDEVIERFGG